MRRFGSALVALALGLGVLAPQVRACPMASDQEPMPCCAGKRQGTPMPCCDIRAPEPDSLPAAERVQTPTPLLVAILVVSPDPPGPPSPASVPLADPHANGPPGGHTRTLPLRL